MLKNSRIVKIANELRDELIKLRSEKNVLNVLDCLLEDPKTINDLRRNTNKLIYLFYRLRSINANLDKAVKEALLSKIEANNKKIKEIANQIQKN